MTGWRQPPVHPRRRMECPHLGLIGALFTIGLHPVGHEWECQCGAVFVVVTGDGKTKSLERRRG